MDCVAMTRSRILGGVLCLVVALLLVIGSPAAAGPAVVRGPWVLMTLPALGTVTWRCDPRGPATAPGLGALGLGFRVLERGATTDIRLHVGTKTLLRRRLDPGQSIQFPFARSRVQQLELTQMTGAGTLVARMRVDFVPHLLATYCYPYLPPRVTVNVFPRR
jgi:hypothetical protein